MGNKQAKQAKAEEKAAKEVAPKVAVEESTTSAGTDDHAAATKIQAVHRGKGARKSKEGAVAPTGSDDHAAATKIQAVHRGKGARKSKEEAVAPTGSDDHAAATKIQAVHRGKGARKSKGGDPTPPSSSAAKAPAASDDLEANARNVLAANPENRCVKYLVSLADSGKLSSLSPEVLAQLTKCAKTGLENGDSGLGCYAMAPADYDELNFFFDPVCNDYHNNPVGDKVHTTNWSLKGVEGLPESGVLDMRDLGLSEPLSMRVRVGRNLTSFPLPGAMTKSDRINFENTMLGAFATLVANDSYGGQVYSMTPNAEWKKVTGKSKNPNLISATKYQELVDAHVMFKDMDADPYLKSAGIASDWPCGRGCYQSADGGFIIWFGEEDQLRIMCMGKGFILNEIFDRLNTALQLVESIKGIEFATSSKYGYVTSCPSNLGTGMRASVHLKIPNLTVDGTDTKAKAAAKPLGLSVRGTGGEHTPIGSDGTVDISPSNRLFITEAEIVTKLYNGIKLLMEKESGANGKQLELAPEHSTHYSGTVDMKDGDQPKGKKPTLSSASIVKAPAASNDLEANARTVLAANPENRCVKYLVSLADSGKLASLSPEVMAQLTKCAKTGLENGDSGLGCYAMAPADYDELNFFFDPVCNDYHNNPTGDKVHTTNWSLKGVEGLPESGVLDMRDLGLSEPLSMRVRVGRNLTSFPLPGAMTKSDRINFEKTMLGAFATLVANDSYGGQVYSMTPNAEWKTVTGESKNPNLISATKYQELVDAHVMFKDMDADPYLKSAGIASDWPCGRGCYQSADGGFIIWFGEEDQLRIMCMGKGFILNEIFDRLNTALQLVESIEGIEFATSSKYGYVTSCPSNLGTGMRASVHLKIPNLTADGTDTKAKAAAKPLGLSVRGTGGEHTPIGSDGTVDISPSNRLFITEAEIVTKLYNGIKLLMEKEGGAATKPPRGSSSSRSSSRSGSRPKSRSKSRPTSASKSLSRSNSKEVSGSKTIKKSSGAGPAVRKATSPAAPPPLRSSKTSKPSASRADGPSARPKPTK